MISLPTKELSIILPHHLNGKKWLLLFYFILLFIISFSPAYTHAQQLPQSVLNTLSGLDTEKQARILEQLSKIPSEAKMLQEAISADLTIQTNPIYPAPNEEVTATIISNITDVNRADIFWYVNDKLEASGKGVYEFEFKTKNTGEAIVVYIVLKTYEGFRIDKKITINPIEVDIIWEAESYTPPFYKGKALLPPKTNLKIVVMPNFTTSTGRDIPANELIYTWREGVDVLRRDSGYGKNVLYTKAPEFFWEKDISVDVSSFNSSLRAFEKINLGVIIPEVILYEDKPTQGVWYGNAIGRDFDISGQELVIKAEPYFFAENDKKAGNLIYDWMLEGKPVVGENDKITFRQEGGEGSVRVDLDIKNVLKRFQYAAKSFVLNFRSAGLFNF